jgi:RNA polymerase sigma-70 factor (ECF subfamily)
MVDDVQLSLRQLFVAGYEDLKRRLTRRLGSADTAAEALHETYLRLDGIEGGEAVRNPAGLLYRMALNTAMDGYRADARWLRRTELEALQHEGEDRLTPERIAMAQSEIALLEAALAEMPARRRAIFMSALIEDVPYRVIAENFGVSVRLVEREVSRALGHAEGRLERKSQRRAGRPPRGTFHDETAGE